MKKTILHRYIKEHYPAGRENKPASAELTLHIVGEHNIVSELSKRFRHLADVFDEKIEEEKGGE